MGNLCYNIKKSKEKMKLTATNTNISNTLTTSTVVVNDRNITETIIVGNVSITSDSIIAGQTEITATGGIITPEIFVGGVGYNGSGLSGIINYQEFYTNGTWYNPYANASVNTALSGYEQAFVMAWGGGGGSSSNNSSATCGGGGACALGTFNIADLPSTISVVVGTGGSATRTTTTALGTSGNGGNSSFGSLVAFGGGGSGANGGGGGGALSAGLNNVTGGNPLGGNVSTYGGGSGGGAGANGGISIFGGGGGAVGLGFGGNTIFGGGGGAAVNSAGLSIFGGNGGTNGRSGSFPGGAGGCNTSAANTGANGLVRVWVLGGAATTLGIPTYNLVASSNELLENGSVDYTVVTTNIANNTPLYYTLNNSSTATAADFSSAVNGSVIIIDNQGTFTLTAADDADATNESFQMDIRTGNSTGTIVASNGSVSIVPAYPVAEYITTASIDGLNSNNYTFTNISIGEASSDRVVAIAFFMYVNALDYAFSNVFVNGSPVTIGVQDSAGGTHGSGFAYVSIPSGTTANVQFRSLNPINTCGIAIWKLTGLQNSTHYSANNTTTLSLTTPVIKGGVLLALKAGSNFNATTWSGITERFDYDTRSGEYFSGGDTTIAANSAAYSVSTSADTGEITSVISWR
jgi:mucin-19